MGRVRTVTRGCFREAQLQGLLFGDEPGMVAGMSRPFAVADGHEFVARKSPFRTTAQSWAAGWSALLDGVGVMPLAGGTTPN